MDPITLALCLAGVLAGLIIGSLMVYYHSKNSSAGLVTAATQKAQETISEARRESSEIVTQAENSSIARRKEIDEEIRDRRREISRVERRIEQREESLDRRTDNLEKQEETIRLQIQDIETQKENIEDQLEGLKEKLEDIAGLTTQEAKSELLNKLDDELREESGRRVIAMEESAKAESEVRARKILATVMQRITSEVTAEMTVSVIPIPSDEVKGRIIGREGRNIRAFEAATGCDLIIDDTPGVVTVSAFEPTRREIARTALDKLIQDGRIQPSRIEDAVDRARADVDKRIEKAGQQAVADAEVTGLHNEIVKTLGRLQFRYSYGQNQLRHCIETSWLAAALAHELGADVEVARVGGLLHDLGKAVDREIEGTHALLGADIARRYGLPEAVTHTIEAHHEEVKPETVEALVVICADAMSGSRPGARREQVEEYVKRLEALETIANSFDGVEQAFAVQAGREIRIMVKPDQIDDLASTRLAREVSREIEQSLQYPGQIKVTVVRETRSTEIAK